MTEPEVLSLLEEAFSCLRRCDCGGFARRVDAARSAAADLGEPPALAGELALFAALAAFPDVRQMLPHLRRADGLLCRRSRVIPKGTPLTLDDFDPFTTFWLEIGQADSTAALMEEAEALWMRLTGGGQGTVPLYRARLAYYRAELSQARTLATEAFRLATDHDQQMTGLAAAEILGLLMRHSMGGSFAESALAYIRRMCEEGADRACVQAAQTTRSNLYLSMGVLSEMPDWLREGDFGAVPCPQPPGWRMLEDKLWPTLVPRALQARMQYLTYAGRYVDALNQADMAQLAFRVSKPVGRLYYDFFRAHCYEALGDEEHRLACLRAMLAGSAPDGLWLIPGECVPVRALPDELVEACGPEAAARLRQVGDGLRDRIAPLREAYLCDHLPANLTRREQEVLELVGSGCSNAQAARALGIGEGTVKTHLNHAFEKMGVTNRAQISHVLGRTRKAVIAAWVEE